MRFNAFLLSVAGLSLAPQVSARITIVGAQTGINPLTGELPARRNINDLYQRGGPAWTLYVRALASMQAADPDEPDSYFQIAGIHGRPYIPWDGGGPAVGPGGYCPHTENIFLPWHRSYLALFEQVLCEHARNIAEEYPLPQRMQYRDAAQELRVPYWDWAADSDVPPAVGTPEIEVTMPDGQATIRNPLYSFVFPQEAVSGKYGPITGSRDPTATRRCSAAEANIGMARVDLKGMVYDVFVRSDTFAKMASMGSNGVLASFEQPHNSVHMRAACGNNFAYPSDAAFDPLFMLHHANVDRLWAMWEELYPEHKSLSPPYVTDGTFGIRPGTTLSSTSALSPFLGLNEVPHTSEQVKDISSFGYTYPEIRPWAGTQDERRSDMAATVNSLYGPSSSSSSSNVAPASDPSIPSILVDSLPRRGAVPASHESHVAEPVVGRVEYFAHIRINASRIPAPCEMNIFVGGKSAGSFGVFTSHGGEDRYVEGEIPMERFIEENGLRAAGRAKCPLDTIRDNIQVEFLQPNGTIVPYSAMEGEYYIAVEDVDVVPGLVPGGLPLYGESRRTPVYAKPAPPRDVCHPHRDRYGDIPGLSLDG